MGMRQRGLLGSGWTEDKDQAGGGGAADGPFEPMLGDTLPAHTPVVPSPPPKSTPPTHPPSLLISGQCLQHNTILQLWGACSCGGVGSIKKHSNCCLLVILLFFLSYRGRVSSPLLATCMPPPTPPALLTTLMLILFFFPKKRF